MEPTSRPWDDEEVQYPSRKAAAPVDKIKTRKLDSSGWEYVSFCGLETFAEELDDKDIAGVEDVIYQLERTGQLFSFLSTIEKYNVFRKCHRTADNSNDLKGKF
ncbi:unnamed protein product [Nezara viridula]|uniref:Uncharacterized protein n=1 Tax=Nezara viridula TaxID=85310 RepID=A0A9P0E8H5_NEZVI|nr:unnamed protein product [Nezara viridula]